MIDKGKEAQRSKPQESHSGQKGKKIRKTLKNNPFEDLPLLHNSDDNNQQQNDSNKWIKPKKTPLTIQISDHSKVNKFYSHKSLQKYIRYLYCQSCPNPMWLSIKRQSQIKKIIYIDMQYENSLFHRNIEQKQEQNCLEFLTQFVCPERKAIFRESPFIKQSKQVWEAMFVYDDLSIKEYAQSQEQNIENKNSLALQTQLTPQLLLKYQTYLLSQEQRKANLYPVKNLPAHKDYYVIGRASKQQEKSKADFNDKILVIDCEMVMSANGFQLARTSIMNFKGKLIYDQFFKPEAQITNYNTLYSGITEETLRNVTKTIDDLHKDLEKFIKPNTILVGHSLENDLHAMKFMHHNVIDTSVLFARRNGSKMKLKTLSQQILNRSIQKGSHCSQQDCKATLQLMRYKIQLQEPQKKSNLVNYHLLSDLLNSKKQVLIIDSDLEFIRHRTEYIGTKFCVVESNRANKVIEPLKIFIKQEEGESQVDIGFTRIRKQKAEQEWEEYYQQFDEQLRELYNQIPQNSVILLNCQINQQYEIYPQDKNTESQRKRTNCIILVKSST